MMVRLALIVTSPVTARVLMRGQLSDLASRGFEVCLITSPGFEVDEVRDREGVDVIEVPMAREISFASDLVSTWRVYRALRRLRPQIANASTPKAGLIGMLAAYLAGVPVRIYLNRGLRLETKTGFSRWVLKCAERIASKCANHVIFVSHSLRLRYLELGLGPPEKTIVLGSGSSNGVDVERYRPVAEGNPGKLRQRLAKQLGIRGDTLVVGFVGRLTQDKGIRDLFEAFTKLLLRCPEAHLLLVGEFEEGDPLPEELRARLKEHPKVSITGMVKDPAPYYEAFTVLAFPSYREGLPNVPLEAAACGLPVVGYVATGTIDAIEDGVSGTLVPIGDIEAFSAALSSYLEEPRKAASHGAAGRRRIERCFRRELVWEQWAKTYEELLDKCNPPH